MKEIILLAQGWGEDQRCALGTLYTNTAALSAIWHKKVDDTSALQAIMSRD